MKAIDPIGKTVSVTIISQDNLPPDLRIFAEIVEIEGDVLLAEGDINLDNFTIVEKNGINGTP
ncbi:MAG: hypothetical protein GY841_15725 [FCB group bacterium]|nr:hypothetical protein [FCB group bacterium]